MKKETINTNTYQLSPVGAYTLEVFSVEKKVLTSKTNGREFTIYEWKFRILESDVYNPNDVIKIAMFSSGMGDLLRALGGTETSPGNFEFDGGLISTKGKWIKCNLVHVPDNKGTLRETLIEIVPLEKTVIKKTEAQKEVAWDE